MGVWQQRPMMCHVEMPPQSLFYAHALHSHPLKPARQWHFSACIQHIIMGDTNKTHLQYTHAALALLSYMSS